MNEAISQLIDLALAEDLGSGDVTSEFFVPEERTSRAFINARETGVIAGTEVAAEVFRRVDAGIQVKVLLPDGTQVTAGDLVIEVEGRSQSVLTAERVALNFMQRLSGVATLTSRFVSELEGTHARLLDTRKTTPGWRLLEKAAVVAGGGTNHRMGLYDRAMVKDNHLVAEGKLDYLQQAIRNLKAEKPNVGVELEADTLDQVADFLNLEGVDQILLDNMSLDELRKAVSMREGELPLLEASGGVNLSTVRAIGETGVDFVSVGAVTHSAIGLDLGLDFVDGHQD